MKALILGLLVLLSGCTSAPIDTVNKRLFAVEASYGAVLDTAILHQSEGRLSKEAQETLAKGVRDYTNARSIARTALGVGDLELAEDNLLRMSQVLELLRPLIVKESNQ